MIKIKLAESELELKQVARCAESSEHVVNGFKRSFTWDMKINNWKRLWFLIKEGNKILGATGCVLNIPRNVIYSFTVIGPLPYGGRHAGREALAQKIEYIQEHFPEGRSFVTEVRSTNIPSINMCIKAGFELTNAYFDSYAMGWDRHSALWPDSQPEEFVTLRFYKEL